ncbi:MAG: ATP-binding protein [Bacillota bacterium]|nr:ATP-binding protein [Bacillota bacterium]
MSKPKGVKTIHFQTIMILSLAASIFLIIFFYALYSSIVSYNRDKAISELIAISQIIAEQLDGDKHQKLTEQGLRSYWLYVKLVKPLHNLQLRFPEITHAYTLVQTDQQDVWKIVLKSGEGEQSFQNAVLFDSSPIPNIHLVKQQTVIIPDEKANRWSSPITVYTPVRNSKNEVVAVLSLVMAIDDLVAQEAKLLKNGLLFLGIIIFGVFIGSTMITGRLLRPLTTISSELQKINIANMTLRLPEKYPGEWSFLTKTFNKLLDENYSYQQQQGELLVRAIKEKETIFQIYRDVIYAVTQGRVFLVTQEEFYQQICDELPLISCKLENKKDISRCRHEIDSFLTDKCDWWIGTKRKQLLLCLSEAITNVIKHAESGEILVSLTAKKIVFYILDQGPGMNLEKLPYMVFINGYTSKNSLGSGFSLIHNYIDKMTICTTEHGTFLTLEAHLTRPNKNEAI